MKTPIFFLVCAVKLEFVLCEVETDFLCTI
jgi:hypothetical protein